jgi:uncharacterized protein YsxB (DUF464 family)
MKLKFSYTSSKRVIKKEDFISQLEEIYNKKYFLKKIDMGEYETTVFVTNNHIREITYEGTDLIYYRISFDNNLPTTLSEERTRNNPDFIEVKLIENESLVVLETETYNYAPMIKEYFTYKENKTIVFDPEKDLDIICRKLSKIWRNPIKKIINYSNYKYLEDVYNGEITITVNNLKYRTLDKYIYKTEGYVYGYIPEESICVMLKGNI